MIHCFGFGCDRVLIEHRLLGIAAAINTNHTEYLVANLEAQRLSTAFFDDAGHIAPERIRQTVVFHRRIFSGTDF